jgi:hypothetical protein
VGDDVFTRQGGKIPDAANPFGLHSAAAEEGMTFLIAFEDVNWTGRSLAEKCDELPLAAIKKVGSTPAGE